MANSRKAMHQHYCNCYSYHYRQICNIWCTLNVNIIIIIIVTIDKSNNIDGKSFLGYNLKMCTSRL